MNWKVKALGQSALSLLPGASKLNYWGQRFITRAHSDIGSVVENRLEKARWFKHQFDQHHGGVLSEGQFYEFGAGWNLTGPLALFCLGVKRQIVVDVTRCARLELVNQAIKELNRYNGYIPRRPGKTLRSLSELDRRFGIDYRAPADARNTALPADSVDCITNTFTLEHIPPADVRAILRECRRILKPGGALLSMIDYQDHYSFRDPQISVYNFLQYSARKWRWFNSSLHYQNRLRHCQYRQMFFKAGFETLSEELREPSPLDLERLRSMRLSAEFQRFSLDDLRVLGSQMVCRKPAQSDANVELATTADMSNIRGASADGTLVH